MKINRKYYILAFVFLICLSIIKNRIGVFQNEEIFYSLGILFFIILISPYIIKMVTLQKRYASIISILQLEKDAARYVQELEEFIHKIKDSKTRNLLNLSLAAGYSENAEYDKAYQILMSMDSHNLVGLNQATYYINMFAITYNLGDEEKAATYLDDNIKLLNRYEIHPTIGSAMPINFVYRYLAENDLKQAKYYLDQAEEVCSIPYLCDTIEYLKADLLVRENCYDEANHIINRLKQNKLTPSIKNKILKLEDIIGF